MSEEKIVDATVMVGWYGRMHRHPWLSPEWEEQDAYRLLVSQAEAMGWSSTGSGGLGHDLWGMNDAGQDWSGSAHPRLAWFQVGLADATGADAPLPLQAITRCSWEAMARVGAVDVDAVQFLVPLQLAGPSAGHLASCLGRFEASDPAARTGVAITVDTGYDAVGQRRAAALLAGMRSFRAGPFRIGTGRDDPLDPQPPLVGDLWMGPTRHPVTFAAQLPEWSPDAIGWPAAFVAEGARKAGSPRPR